MTEIRPSGKRMRQVFWGSTIVLWLGVLLHSILLFVMNQQFPFGAVSTTEVETRFQLREAAEFCCDAGMTLFLLGMLVLLGLCIAIKPALSVRQLVFALLAAVLGALICTVPFAALDRLLLQDSLFWKDFVLVLFPVVVQLMVLFLVFLVVTVCQRRRARTKE